MDDFLHSFVFSLELVPWDSQGTDIRWLSIQLWPGNNGPMITTAFNYIAILGDFSLLYNTALPCCRQIACR